MSGVDTSVVLRLLTGEPEKQARAAEAWLERHSAAGQRVEISDLVLAETYFALQFHYGVGKAEALKALREMVDDPAVAASEAARGVLAIAGLSRAKPGFVDRLIHAGYRSGGSGMATFEKAAGKLPGVTVLAAAAAP
jgi:predicted nucleic-acid-binding protein